MNGLKKPLSSHDVLYVVHEHSPMPGLFYREVGIFELTCGRELEHAYILVHAHLWVCLHMSMGFSDLYKCMLIFMFVVYVYSEYKHFFIMCYYCSLFFLLVLFSVGCAFCLGYVGMVGLLTHYRMRVKKKSPSLQSKDAGTGRLGNLKKKKKSKFQHYC